jgi:8-oxo-dGTP pyrophosphatase MutT (NUDIX family)
MQNATPNLKRRSISSRKNNSGKERHRTEVSAGGLVFKRTPQGIVFAMVMDSYGKWAFPKGHVRFDERYREAAIREIREEMGLGRLRTICRLDTIDIWFRDRFVHKGKLVHKYIHYFLFEAPTDAGLVRPAPQEKGETIHDVAWVPAGELLSRSSYRDMVGIIKKALRLCSSPSSKTSKHSAPKARV